MRETSWGLVLVPSVSTQPYMAATTQIAPAPCAIAGRRPCRRIRPPVRAWVKAFACRRRRKTPAPPTGRSYSKPSGGGPCGYFAPDHLYLEIARQRSPPRVRLFGSSESRPPSCDPPAAPPKGAALRVSDPDGQYPGPAGGDAGGAIPCRGPPVPFFRLSGCRHHWRAPECAGC